MDDPDGEEVLHYTVDTPPAWYDGHHRVSLGPFVGNTTATRFTVGPGVTEIGERTFYKCSRLSSLQGMGEGVSRIGESAFNGSSLVTLQGMGANVTAIGTSAFAGCKALTSLLGIPESVMVISSCAFYGCTSLTSLEGLPDHLAAIGTSSHGDAGSVFYGCHGLTSLHGLSKNITELGKRCFTFCSGITSLQGGECITVIGNSAFSGCDALTTLQGLSRNVTAIGDPGSQASSVGVFQTCKRLVSIGPGFSPGCFVHPHTFDSCPALLAAAEAEGFSTAIEWGRHRWLAHPASRRFTVLAAVRQVRRDPPSATPPSPLLSLLAGAPDDMVRVIVGFMGEGVVESAQEAKARWELTAFKQGREMRRQRERVERLEERVEQQREQMERQREQMEERVERLEGLLRRELEGRKADEGDRRVRQKREE